MEARNIYLDIFQESPDFDFKRILALAACPTKLFDHDPRNAIISGSSLLVYD